MPQLCMVIVPGLNVASDWATVHNRLLDDFPEVTDVLATTMPATLLIVYEREADIGAWLEGIGAGILSLRLSASLAPRVRTQTPQRRRGAGSASRWSVAAGPDPMHQPNTNPTHEGENTHERIKNNAGRSR